MQPRLVDQGGLRLAGIRRSHPRAKMASDSRRQWMDLVVLGRIPGQAAQTGYGLHLEAPDAEMVDYLAAVEVDGFEALPATLERIALPQRRYAVFEHRGHAAEARSLRDRLAGGELAALGLTADEGPDFERYDENFDPITATGLIELWFPVRA
ncbi:GyrI-like domain-containing protein [Sphingomonas sp. AOB5]|uniref:GyrI-like domain-containing protein n=1 Tax=Sphingomonas sp. AOB5 TaxID=3034017 RepID=UPI0023F9DF93|nr:GyrI-like domain-containing protein [Sphingomonas sp. AOB5]MDF7773901.1 GyrI-like domain-containing protein [Sphingomonas sp. AOB5]